MLSGAACCGHYGRIAALPPPISTTTRVTLQALQSALQRIGDSGGLAAPVGDPGSLHANLLRHLCSAADGYLCDNRNNIQNRNTLGHLHLALRHCCSSTACMVRCGWTHATYTQHAPGLLLSRRGEGRGFWTQNLVHQKWPDQIFPIVNFVFSHYGHFGLGRGGGGFGGRGPPPLVLNYSKEALACPSRGCRLPICSGFAWGVKLRSDHLDTSGQTQKGLVGPPLFSCLSHA